jgi:hypothetical protein
VAREHFFLLIQPLSEFEFETPDCKVLTVEDMILLFISLLKKNLLSDLFFQNVLNFELLSISPTFYERICVNILAPKNFQTLLNVSTKKFCTKLSHEKAAGKMLVKLTPAILPCKM